MSAKRPPDPTNEAEAVRLLRIALAMAIQKHRGIDLPFEVLDELSWALAVTARFDPYARPRDVLGP